jgi:hypothetical protein
MFRGCFYQTRPTTSAIYTSLLGGRGGGLSVGAGCIMFIDGIPQHNLKQIQRSIEPLAQPEIIAIQLHRLLFVARASIQIFAHSGHGI